MAVLTSCGYRLGGRHSNGMTRERGSYGKAPQQTPCHTQKSIWCDSSLTSVKLLFLIPPEYNLWPFGTGARRLASRLTLLKSKMTLHQLHSIVSNWISSALCTHEVVRWQADHPTKALTSYSESLLQVSSHCSSSTRVCQRGDEIPRSASWSRPIFTTDLVNAIFNLLEVERGVHAMLTSQFKSFPLGINGG